ncbi:MAG: amino acid ABC transporter substrate-binding protein [Gammaproteobacteria bacterium]|nr:MAG: amino acid ABC transporter substrate-binding protein [Gammaproteobacteria bacterium]
MVRFKKTILALVIIALAAISLLYLLPQKQPIKVGFIADLSSKRSQLGIAGRNGAILAVNEINAKGGVNGRNLELIISDNQAQKDIAARQASDLVKQGAEVIIGPLLSAMAQPIINAVKDKDMLIISPTVSTDKLTAIDDNFLRVIPHASQQGEALARIAAKKQIGNVFIIRDKRNDEYTSSVSNAFKSNAKQLMIDVIDDISFEDSDKYSQFVENLIDIQPEGILFISSGVDAGRIAQRYKQKGGTAQMFGSSWCKVTNVHIYGGRAVEGMIIVDSFGNREKAARELAFDSSHQKQFGHKPNLPARHSYEAVQIYALGVAMAKTTETRKVKQSILEIDPIEGVADKYRLDKYGDVERKLSLYVIKDREYQLLNGE